MKIDDLLSIAGETPLKSFTWGSGVVDAINTMLPIERHLTVEVSGDDAREIMRALPSAALVPLLIADLDPATGQQAVKAPTVTEVVPVVVPASIQQAPPKNPRLPLTYVVGGAMVLVAVILAVATSVSIVKTGQEPDNKALQSTLSILKDVVQVSIANDKKNEEAAKSDQQQPTNSPPPTEPAPQQPQPQP